MGSNPLNLALRFVLELVALFGLGAWGWRAVGSPVRYVLVAGLPVLAAVLWGVFAVPDDPSRSGRAPIAVRGFLRLGLELLVFGLGALALREAGLEQMGFVFALIVLIHYAISYDRVAWLLRH